MRFIPTRYHAPLDYIVGAVLIAAPWIFQFSDTGAATAVSIVLGVGLIAYSLFTNYELGVWKVAPMAVHNLIDIVAGALLAAGSDRDESQMPALGWLEQTRRGIFERHTLSMGAPRHATLDVGDFDADGDADIVVGVMSPDPKIRTWVEVWENQRKTVKR